MKTVFVIYILDENRKPLYLVSSGGMDFSKDINNAYCYNSSTVENVANYIKRTKTGKASLEVGYIEIQRTMGKQTVI